ncbi:hypothetical protein PG994_003463 [Apiospora phragmitis]|uniref:Protein kinase domain-containing protein n=1 Tax=Apiospora phragmitis TaxID=2905665 RepID=A0ABR1W0V8_9PEZI
MSSGFSSFLDAHLRPPNLPVADRPAAQPNPFVTPPNRPTIPVTAAAADQVPLPAPPFEALRAVRHHFVRGGQYAYEGRAGSGAFGSVYTLRQIGGQQQGSPESGRRVAAKLIRRFPDPRYASNTPVTEVEALEVSFSTTL